MNGKAWPHCSKSAVLLEGLGLELIQTHGGHSRRGSSRLGNSASPRAGKIALLGPGGVLQFRLPTRNWEAPMSATSTRAQRRLGPFQPRVKVWLEARLLDACGTWSNIIP